MKKIPALTPEQEQVMAEQVATLLHQLSVQMENARNATAAQAVKFDPGSSDEMFRLGGAAAFGAMATGVKALADDLRKGVALDKLAATFADIHGPQSKQ